MKGASNGPKQLIAKVKWKRAGYFGCCGSGLVGPLWGATGLLTQLRRVEAAFRVACKVLHHDTPWKIPHTSAALWVGQPELLCSPYTFTSECTP